MPYLIEKGIPIPENPDSLVATLRAMGVGDSILLDKPFRSGLHNIRLKPKRFTSRKTRDGWRVWRIL